MAPPVAGAAVSEVTDSGSSGPNEPVPEVPEVPGRDGRLGGGHALSVLRSGPLRTTDRYGAVPDRGRGGRAQSDSAGPASWAGWPRVRSRCFIRASNTCRSPSASSCLARASKSRNAVQ